MYQVGLVVVRTVWVQLMSRLFEWTERGSTSYSNSPDDSVSLPPSDAACTTRSWNVCRKVAIWSPARSWAPHAQRPTESAQRTKTVRASRPGEDTHPPIRGGSADNRVSPCVPSTTCRRPLCTEGRHSPTLQRLFGKRNKNDVGQCDFP